ncbi:hypothetical protein TVAG_551840 [Trichomonas vaginalis G3]|uniref:Uncharacterized protein n=1 Tax=Trichomonas vaginalis (strain ATCC PRA-98 / G3) TaxID=412133 RepID=A2FX22_TRIV3|nr:spectrin binding [Trichomonas vaginalis G3]EAX90544.1 hypothetical protein TVAG_551840 [Trichomonas vaginalis G3]KAI5497743.1 spectrin binding [Trichomonas vaginalis G3]|eukprot:XP_001303474.1 hypothetical protein [Trichomonas vaginalis G3]
MLHPSAPPSRLDVNDNLVDLDCQFQQMIEELSENNYNQLVDLVSTNYFPYNFAMAMFTSEFVTLVERFPQKNDLFAKLLIELDEKYKNYLDSNNTNLEIHEKWKRTHPEHYDLQIQYPLLFEVCLQGLYMPRLILTLSEMLKNKSENTFDPLIIQLKSNPAKSFDSKRFDKESGYEINSIPYYIYKDDDENLKKLGNEINFNQVQIKNAYNHPKRLSVDTTPLNITYLALAAKLGSKKCFDYLKMKTTNIDHITVKLSIEGGNDEIFQELYEIYKKKSKIPEEKPEKVPEKDQKSSTEPPPARKRKISCADLIPNKQIQKKQENIDLDSKIMHYAIKMHRYRYFEMFFDKLEKFDDKILSIACLSNNVRVAKRIIEKYPDSIDYPKSDDPVNISYTKPLHRALQANSNSCALLILNSRRNDKDPIVEQPATNRSKPLNWSAGWNNYECSRVLIERGALVDFERGRQPLMSAAGKDYFDIVELLLEHKANANSVDYKGSTVLLQAVENKCWRSTYLLLKAGANIDFQHTVTGLSALHIAVKNDSVECAALLSIFGANPLLKDKNGETVQYYLTSKYEKNEGMPRMHQILNFTFDYQENRKLLKELGFTDEELPHRGPNIIEYPDILPDV